MIDVACPLLTTAAGAGVTVDTELLVDAATTVDTTMLPMVICPSTTATTHKNSNNQERRDVFIPW